MIDARNTYLISPSVDVYKIGNDAVEFYFVDTRRRIELEVTSDVFDLISSLTDTAPLQDNLERLSLELDENVEAFLSFLLEEKVIYVLDELDKKKSILNEHELVRYDRQLSFFESYFHDSAYEIQKKISSMKFLVFGVGAVGAGLVQQLVMCGALNFVLVDKDVVSIDSVERHYFFKQKYIGMPKVFALADFLKKLNSEVQCTCIDQLVDFDTPIEKFISNADFVINTMDEPYLGITSLKVGRACYAQSKPLYVAGGFDAHLMSTGELIVPHKTPCVDCYTNFFTSSLKNWKPHYNVDAIPRAKLEQNIFEVGGLASMALWASSYAVSVILQYVATGKAEVTKGRGELLFEELNINYLNIPKDRDCYCQLPIFRTGLKYTKSPRPCQPVLHWGGDCRCRIEYSVACPSPR